MLKRILWCACALACAAAPAEENAAPADTLARSAGASAPAEIPLAPPEYRRPPDWKPKLYPKTIAEISRECSADQMARAAELMARVDEVNAKGKWKATGESVGSHQCPEWFVDAKFGIFVDWGLWSLASWCPYVKGERLYPDWYEFRCDKDFPAGSPMHGMREYHERNWGSDFKRDHFIDLFRAEKFDAPALMDVFKRCGARYVVPFLKHHSGFCLWDCSWTFRDSVDQGPRRDLAAEMAAACRERGLKFGFYDSQAGEWEYPILRDDGSIGVLYENRPGALLPLTPDIEWKASGKVAVKDFVREYIVPQAVEFIDRYDPDIFWGDYDWTGPAAENGSYDIAAYMYNRAEGRKEVAVNDRLGLGTPEELKGHFKKDGTPLTWLRTVRGDFFTDESGDTADRIDPAKWHPWEECRGISLAYGNHWQDTEDSVMSEREFIVEFADIVARGGNLLLLVNLDGQGAIPDVQRRRLLQIGKWLERWGEAIYATRIVAPFATPKVDYTRSRDGACVYAIVKEPSREVTLECAAKVESATVLGEPDALPFERVAGGVKVAVPAKYASSDLPFAIKLRLAR